LQIFVFYSEFLRGFGLSVAKFSPELSSRDFRGPGLNPGTELGRKGQTFQQFRVSVWIQGGSWGILEDGSVPEILFQGFPSPGLQAVSGILKE
jgi:hypothetical protein